MLGLFLEDKKSGLIFLGLSIDRLPADIWSHLLTFADPRQMATRADQLWTVRGRVNSVQTLSPQNYEFVALVSRRPRIRLSSSRTRSPGPSTSSSCS